jgi:hypothetical protein
MEMLLSHARFPILIIIKFLVQERWVNRLPRRYTNGLKRCYRFNPMVWKVLTDLSERPEIGETTAHCREIRNGIVFTGLLACLPGNSGKVGFAIVRRGGLPPFFTGDRLKFKATSSRNDVYFSVALEDDQMQTAAGELSFEQQFLPQTHEQDFEFNISDFTPKIRGRLAREFTLKSSQIVSFSFQILRSRQDEALLIESPLAFELTVTWY